MCTYETTVLEVAGQHKAAGTWGKVGRASVYLDHPVAFPALHSLNIDLFDPQGARRGALELDPGSARALAHAILDLLDRVPQDLLG
jgi:hypothetical protein